MNKEMQIRLSNLVDKDILVSIYTDSGEPIHLNLVIYYK